MLISTEIKFFNITIQLWDTPIEDIYGMKLHKERFVSFLSKEDSAFYRKIYLKS